MDKPNWQPTKVEYWQHLPAPARPWPSEVKWFEKYVLDKKKKNKKEVLILGSTVEFRSMLHKNEVNVYVVDFSKEFYKILSETQSERLKYAGHETFYEENWLTMNLGKEFDLILGDWVPGVLHTKDYGEFFENIKKHLKKDGLFIARECLRPDRSEVDLNKVIECHYKKYAEKFSFYESSMQFLYGYKIDATTSMWNMPVTRQAWDDVCKNGLIKKEDYEPMRTILEIELDKSVSVMVKEDFEKEVKNYFDVIAEHHVEEPSSDWYPIYVMKKK